MQGKELRFVRMKTLIRYSKGFWTKALLIYLLLQSAIACSDAPSDQQPEVPSNLDVQVTVATDDSGKVDVSATADKAKYFNIFFGDGASETPVLTNDGKASHTYSASGNYEVKVQAHTAISAFITKTEVISVTVKAVDPNEFTIPTQGATSPLTYDNMTLAWQDEFEGDAVNTNFWTFETGTGGGGWGNNELEYYRKENTSLKDGVLVITAKKESYGGANYTSSRMITNGKKAFKYGRIDIRAALPKGQGIWPALWMLGSSIGSVGWPACGEIDIMEQIGNPKTVYGTLHWDQGNNNHACTCDNNSYTLASGNLVDQFHVFSLIWTDTSVKWLVDGVQYRVIDTSPAAMSEFRENFFFIFNLAVGGAWPGNPDGSTVFPQRMFVDYIRVFQNN
jgi:beta-glucanase (GH16 family)